MSAVAIDEMRPRLLTIDDVITKVEKTEPLSVNPISQDSNISFRFNRDWEEELDHLHGTDTVGAFITVDGEEHQLTRDGVEQASANVNVTKKNLKTIPGHLMEQILSHFYQNLGETEYNMLSVRGQASSFTRHRIVPFSNVRLIESVVEGIQKYYGQNTEILADYKNTHSLTRTDIRFIVPEGQRAIQNGGLADVPHGQDDLWSTGISLTNSLSAKTPTAVESYLFRWWCTNGATESLGSVGSWNRKSNGQTEGVYDWARESVDEVLGGMEARFQKVQKLTEIEMKGGNTGDVLKEIYSQYAVPVAQRDEIASSLLSANAITMYTIMAAITQAANNPDLDPTRADRLLRVGGHIPSGIFDPARAQVWREGNTSEPGSTNPYEIYTDN